MKRYKPQFKQIVKEADDNEATTLKAVQELIDMGDISTEEEQGKFLELLKGIVFADNKHGDEFLKQINDFTSSLKIEDFKEGCKKKPKKKDLKEALSIHHPDFAVDIIDQGFRYLAVNKKYNYIITDAADGIINGLNFGTGDLDKTQRLVYALANSLKSLI